MQPAVALRIKRAIPTPSGEEPLRGSYRLRRLSRFAASRHIDDSPLEVPHVWGCIVSFISRKDSVQGLGVVRFSLVFLS